MVRKRNITLVRFFREALRHICVTAGALNLRVIENCIFSIRSIERNMRPILRTDSVDQRDFSILNDDIMNNKGYFRKLFNRLS
jgi:hypothetical protein